MNRSKNENLSLIKESRNDKIFDVVIHILAVIIIILVIYPLWYVVVASISSPAEVARGNVIFWAKEATLKAYQTVMKDQSIISGYYNTIKVAVTGVVVNVFMTTCCAYPLSRKNLAGNSLFTKLITFTMFFNAGMIPNYLLIKDLNLLNSIWSLILPGAISAYNMLVMRNYFLTSIPNELIDAAAIDGCSHIGTFVKIVLPLSKPILAVIFIFCLVGHWNAYFDAMLYIRDADKYPLQLVLRELLIESKTYAAEGAGFGTADSALAYVTIQYACIIVSTIPVLIMYPFMQKYFVKGVMIGAVKG